MVSITKNIIYISLICLFFVGCEDNGIEFTRYDQQVLTGNDNSLLYNTKTSYPLIGDIRSDEPNVNFVSPYRFRVLNVTSADESSFVRSSFTINPNTGVVRYNNAANSISPGTYSVSVGVYNSNGLATHNEVYSLNIVDVPVEVNVDQSTVEAGIFQQGVMATVSYNDTSNGDITSVTYSLINPPSGFNIDAQTGEISKVTGAQSGDNSLSVQLNTNAGIIVANNVVNIKVGEAPTIQFVKQDGDDLAKTILSPNTSYTTAAPKVNGMIPKTWELILPDSLKDFGAGFSVEEPSGKVSIAASSGLPLGTHVLSLKAVNDSSSEFTFEDCLTLQVEERWDETPMYVSDLSSLGSEFTLHKLNGSLAVAGYNGNHAKAKVPVLKFQIPSNNNINAKYYDGAIELKLPVQSTTKKLRISFYEVFGYNNFFANRYARTLSHYQSMDDSNPPLDPSSWTSLMDDDDASWSGSTGWSTLGPDLSRYNKVSNKEIEISEGTANVYLFWRVFLKPTFTKLHGQMIIRNIVIESSGAFDAIEM